MKDEHGGKSILKLVGLKSKMYSILDESNDEKITTKGHNGFIEFQNFMIHYLRKRFLDTQSHNLGTYETNKKIFIMF